MRRTAVRGARSTLSRALRPWGVTPRLVRFADDPYLLYTATLVPIVVIVTLIAQRPGELGLALALSGAALATQALLGSIGRRNR